MRAIRWNRAGRRPICGCDGIVQLNHLPASRRPTTPLESHEIVACYCSLRTATAFGFCFITLLTALLAPGASVVGAWHREFCRLHSTSQLSRDERHLLRSRWAGQGHGRCLSRGMMIVAVPYSASGKKCKKRAMSAPSGSSVCA